MSPTDRYLSDEDVTVIRDAFKQEITVQLDSRARVPNDKHTAHHEWLDHVAPWLDARIERHKRREQAIEKIKEQVFGWGIIVSLAALGAAVYQHVVDTLAKAIK